MRAWPSTSRRGWNSASSLILLCSVSGCQQVAKLVGEDRPIVYVDIRERDPALAGLVPRPAIEAAMKEVLKDLPG